MVRIPVISNIIEQKEEDKRLEEEFSSWWWEIYNNENRIKQIPEDGFLSQGVGRKKAEEWIEFRNLAIENLKISNKEIRSIILIQRKRSEAKRGLLGTIKFYISPLEDKYVDYMTRKFLELTNQSSTNKN